MKKSNIITKVVKNVAYKTAEKNANSLCAYFFHQPKLPKAVQKLRKF